MVCLYRVYSNENAKESSKIGCHCVNKEQMQNNILGGKLNFFTGKQNLGSLCPNGQVPSKVNVGPCCSLYKYDIPVGFPPGITSPREDCRLRATILSLGLQNTKGGKITNTRDFG